MRCLPLFAILLPTTALATPGPNPIPKTNTPVIGKTDESCPRVASRRVGDVPPPGARKLGDMPPAKPIYTVVREIDGCPIPVSVGAR